MFYSYAKKDRYIDIPCIAQLRVDAAGLRPADLPGATGVRCHNHQLSEFRPEALLCQARQTVGEAILTGILDTSARFPARHRQMEKVRTIHAG